MQIAVVYNHRRPGHEGGRWGLTHLGMVYLKSWGMRKIGFGGLYVKLSAHVLGVSQTWTD